MNEIGIMQGRLLTKYKGRYQAHPLGYWQKEFSVANRFSLSNIEFKTTELSPKYKLTFLFDLNAFLFSKNNGSNISIDITLSK